MRKRNVLMAVSAFTLVGLSAMAVGGGHLFNASGESKLSNNSLIVTGMGGGLSDNTSDTDTLDTSAYELCGTYDDWTSTNQGQQGSVSSNEWEIIVPSSDAILSFDYMVSSEGGCDILNVIINDGSSDRTLVETSGDEKGSTTFKFSTAGTYKLTAQYRKDGSVDNGLDIGSVSNIKLLVNNPIGVARDYLSEIEGKAGLVAELTAAIDKAEAAEDTLKYEEYRNLSIVLANVKKANSYYPQMQVDIAEGDSLLTTGEFEGLADALNNAKELDVSTASSSDYFYHYNNVRSAVSISKASLVDISEWAFGDDVFSIDGLKYYIDSEHKLAKFFRPSSVETTSIVVPSTINIGGDVYTVVAIGNYNYWWGENCLNLKELILPNTIRLIGSYAFREYPNLSWVELPKNVQVIQEAAFENAGNLYWVKLNSQVPPTCTGNIGGTSFKRLIIPDGTMHAYRLSNYLGNYNLVTETPIEVSVNVADPGDLGRLVLEKAGYLQEVNKLTVTGELNSDDWKSIKDMSNLIEIDLSEIVNTGIPSSLFSNRWAIEKVKFPNGLKSIGNEAFYSMGIIEIVLPEGLETIGDYAFYNCNNATKIELPSTLKTIGYYAFAENSSVKSVVIPNSVTSIGSYAFNNCSGLEELVLSENINDIREYSFAYTKIKTLNIPEKVSQIKEGAFYSCNKLSQVNLNNGLKTIASSAFAYCDSIKHIDFNEGLQTIGNDAFYDCDGLTELTLPSSLTYCTASPFTNCRNLKRINARSVIPPTTNGYCPIDNVTLNDVVLTVPVWSVQEYQLAEGWNQFKTVEASDYLPQNVVINKNFVFSLTQAFVDDYKPNINLEMTNARFTDSWNYDDYQRGNLTISSQSKLNVNDFNFVSSPYAKYHYDYGRYYDYWNTTEVNPTCLLVNGEMRAENVNMRMKLYKSKWQFVSFPFDVKVSDIVPVDPETQWVIREYSGANRAEGLLDTTWVNIKGESVLSAGKGYIMHCYNNSNTNVVDFDITPYKESVNRQGLFFAEDKTVALEEHLAEFEHNRSWNLIGNPYPTFYDTRFLGFESPITVWNSYTNSYYAYSPVDDSYILDPNEAFFVQRPIDQENMTLAKEGRQVHRHIRTLEQNNRANAYQVMAPRCVYNLTLGDENMSDRTRIVINEAAEPGYELNRDASKFMSDNAQMPQLYTLNGEVRYAINERPLAGGEVALGCRLPKDGTYTIALETNIEGEVYIEDRLTGEIVLLTSEGYSFTANAGEYLTRFVVHFGPVAPTGIDGVDVDADGKVSGVTLDGKAVGESYKGIVVNKNRKSFKK